MSNTPPTQVARKALPRPSHQYATNIWKSLLIFVMFTLTIALVGAFVFQHYRDTIKKDSQDELRGIAELKIKEVVNWMNGRKRDAQALRDDPLFTSTVERWFRQGSPVGDTRTKLAARLSSMQQNYAMYGYSSISLFDEQGRLRLSSSADELPPQEMEKKLLLDSISGGQIVFSDVHKEIFKNKERTEIELRAPLTLTENGKKRSIGAVLFRIDPSLFLFPLIQFLPISSQSAENLLVRREGNVVIFLNELRYRKNAALSMSVPFSQAPLPALMAAMGYEGVLEGDDYRGVPVVGVLSKIPDTTWAMVSKIDRAEIYAPINQLTNWVLALMLILIGSGAGLVVYWRKRAAIQFGRELERQALVQLIDYLSKYANDIILLSDSTGKIIDFNDRALEAYGYSADVMLLLNLSDLQPIDFTHNFASQLEELNLTGTIRFESTHVRHNGESFDIEATMRVIGVDENKFYQSIIRDISEHKLAAENLHRLNRTLRMLSSCNAALVHTEEEPRLLLEICKLIVVVGGYKMAWVGVPEHDAAKTVRTVAKFGTDDGYLDSANISWADTKLGGGPTGIAIKTGMVQISQNFMSNPLTAPWRDAAFARGFKSNIALPLKIDSRTFAVLTLYSAESNAFITEEVALLEELAADVAWGISALRIRAGYEQAVERLRQSEERFRFLIENTKDVVFLMSPATGHYTYISPASSHLLGYTPEELLAAPMILRGIVHADSHIFFAEQWAQIMAGKTPPPFEYQIIHKSGEVRWVFQRIEQVSNGVARKIPAQIQGVIVDITERKLAEAKLENERIRMRTLLQTIPDLIWLKDADGTFLSCNRQMERLYGAKEADIVGKTDYDFVDVQLADWFRKKDQEAMAADKPCISEEWVAYPDTGQRALLETIKTPMRDESGRLIGVMGIARDITERKHAEEREMHLRHTLDNTLDMIFIFRPDTLHFVYVNKGAIESTGYNIEELMMLTPPNISPLLPELAFRKLIAPLISGEKKLLRFERLHRNKQGGELSVEVQLQFIQEANRESVFIAIVRDITERKLAEEELQKQKSFMWQVIDADPSQIFVKDNKGKYLLVNRSTAIAHGLTPNEMVGMNHTESNRASKNIDDYLTDDRRVIEEGCEINRITPYTLPNGEQLWYLTIKKRLMMPDGKLSVLGIAVDITQQKLFEIELAESYKVLQRLTLRLENVKLEERAAIALNLHD